MIFRQEIEESLTLKFAHLAAERRKKGLPIISLGLGEPDFKVPEEIIEATVQILQTSSAGYSSPMGISSLREKIAFKLLSENNIPATANNILITPGAKQAFLLALMALLEPEDEIIVLNPSYVSFIPQICIAEPRAKITIIDVRKSDFSVPIDHISNLVSSATKILILNSPNNPAGYIFSKEELNKLFDLAIKYDFYIISDEIYEKLIFTHDPHLSVGSLESTVERVLTVNGFSKSHAMTGWRIGYLCFPQSLYQKLLKLQQHINTNTCTLIQLALDQAFYHDQSYLTVYNNKLASRAAHLTLTFKDLHPTRLILPKAGFFAFVNISHLNMDSNTFCGKLIEETGVATTPGVAFGSNWDDHFRISFATSDENLDKGLKLIRKFVSKFK